jgi:hypothetical protein
MMAPTQGLNTAPGNKSEPLQCDSAVEQVKPCPCFINYHAMRVHERADARNPMDSTLAPHASVSLSPPPHGEKAACYHWLV